MRVTFLLGASIGLSLALSAASFAKGPVKPGAEAAEEPIVEVRTLKEGSAIRRSIESKLGVGRVADNFTLKMTLAPSIVPSNVSVIDMLEQSSLQKDILDPISSPKLPDGNGAFAGFTAETQTLCATVMVSGSATQANVTWNWVWRPDSDTNGDGRVNNSDKCPCSWVLMETHIENFVQNNPLEC